MKKRILLTLFLAVGVIVSLVAHEPKPRFIVLVNTATWCPSCKANGPRVEKDVLSNQMQNKEFKVIINNLSDASTRATSLGECKQAGIEQIVTKNKTTGVIYFIDANTKQIITKIPVKRSSEEINQKFADLLKTK